MKPGERFKKKLGGRKKGRKKKIKAAKKGMRARKMQGSFYNEPSYTHLSLSNQSSRSYPFPL